MAAEGSGGDAFTHSAFSAAATPFGWLLKERAWG
jgi:hypothetical protein